MRRTARDISPDRAAILVALAIVFALGAGRYLRRRGGVDDSGVSFVCPGCGQRLKVNAAVAGKAVKCAQCGTAVLFPSAAEAPRHV